MNPHTIKSPAEVWDDFIRIAREGMAAPGPEEALSCITRFMVDALGDKAAHLRPGGLKEGERQYAVAAVLFVSPDHRLHQFVAQQNFPPAQHHFRIPIDLGHPGSVWRDRRPLLLANTDDHADFKQILQSSRMGSSCYVPIVWRGEMVGQLIAGTQARHTYRAIDLEIIRGFAELAGALWFAHGGPAFLSGLLDNSRGGG